MSQPPVGAPASIRTLLTTPAARRLYSTGTVLCWAIILIGAAWVLGTAYLVGGLGSGTALLLVLGPVMLIIAPLALLLRLLLRGASVIAEAHGRRLAQPETPETARP